MGGFNIKQVFAKVKEVVKEIPKPPPVKLPPPPPPVKLPPPVKVPKLPGLPQGGLLSGIFGGISKALFGTNIFAYMKYIIVAVVCFGAFLAYKAVA